MTWQPDRVTIQEDQMDPHSGAQAQKEFDQAQRELDRGNVLAALACLERALATWDDPLWYSRLGFCIAKERGHLTRAFELCHAAIAKDPKNPVHYLYLGKVHQIAANQYEALQALRQGMTLGTLPEIESALAAIGTRKPPVIPAISRSNPLNKYLGLIMTRLGIR
jgi:tetratricopeptide (TPR) repeat protein